MPPVHGEKITQPGKEGLDVVRDSDAECRVYRLRYAVFHRYSVALGQALETIDAGGTVPWAKAIGVEVVDAVGYPESAHQWLEADAARNDEDRRVVSEILQCSAQPTQESFDPVWITVIGQHTLQEDGQLIDGQEHGSVMGSAVAKQLLSVTPPASRIQIAADSDPKVGRADLLDVVAEPAAHRTSESPGDRTNRMGGLGDARDGILRTGCALDISEEKCPALCFKPASELSNDACLSHAPLASQEYMVAIFGQPFQDSQVGIAVEEVVATYPAARG